MRVATDFASTILERLEVIGVNGIDASKSVGIATRRHVCLAGRKIFSIRMLYDCESVSDQSKVSKRF